MDKVVLTLDKYEQLKKPRYEAEKKARQLERQLKELTEEGKVAVVTQTRFPFDFLIGKKPEVVQVVALDTIKDEVTAHFRKGLFDEQLSQQLGDRLKQLTDQEAEIRNLKSEIERMKHRSLWERIRNK